MQTQTKLNTSSTSIPLLRGILCPLAILSLPLFSFAQESEEDEVFELSPFTVDGSEDSGYRASNTLAGTRLNSEMKDVAATVTGYTEQFLEDIGATDLKSILAYSPSAELDIGDNSQNPGGNNVVDSRPAANFRVRGLGSTRAQNFFNYGMPIDVYNIGRLDESRGPNSLLFGVGEAGGIINSTTKQAGMNRDFAHLQLRFGSENFKRASADINQVIIDDKFAIRTNFLVEDSDDWRYNLGEEDRRAHIAGTFNFNENTKLRAEYEIVSQDDIVGRPYQMRDDYSQWDGTLLQSGHWNAVTPGINRSQWWGAHVLNYVGNDGTVVDTKSQMRTDNWFYEAADYYNNNYTTWWREAQSASAVADPDVVPTSVVTSGTGGKRFLDLEVLSAYYEQKIGDDFFLELAARHQDSEWVSHWSGNSEIRRDPNANSLGGAENPYAGQYYLEGGWDRRTRDISENTLRATASYKLDLENSRHNFVAMASIAEEKVKFTNEALYIVSPDILGNTTDPTNGIYRGSFRQYFPELGDWENFHIPSWEDVMSSSVINGPTSGSAVAYDWRKHHSAQNDDTFDKTAALIAAQSFWLGGDLVTTFGYRYDKIDYSTYDVIRPYYYEIDYTSPNDKSNSAPTITAGAVYHVNEKFSVFYNQSDNTNNPDYLINVLPRDLSADGEIPSVTPDPTEGQGWDTGVMFDLFDGKINGRLTYFEAENIGQANWSYGYGITTGQVNQLLSAMETKGLIDVATKDLRTLDNVQGTLLDDKSDGYELSVTGNLTPNFRMQANFSITNRDRFNTYVDADRLIENYRNWFLSLPSTQAEGLDTEIRDPVGDQTVGESAESFFLAWSDDVQGHRIAEEIGRGLRKYKANLFATYDFKDGPMDGLSVGGGVRYNSANIVGVDQDGNVLKGEALEYVDLRLSYKFSQKLFDKVAWDIGLNVSNLFEQDGIIPIRYATIPIENANNANERNPYSDPSIIDAASFFEPRRVIFTVNFRM
ncbi:TonB-dependent receptor plug domain-containing protein [Pelagicoccus enzymogenes]|uniref:TonB-dependent siderophore receptor n=1 Tax=Pelagicoccus enzymogenes TaxID=2773457 RepID=UPI00280FC0F6|nr:TonB-dependent receptor plug domain-containing protein [Pelagicoccus enzymogenes]MDQ8198010.1 TonB-dependent receptor plug domain-containing protein [Pelagicoccus enzymogenes]